jgi:hypothetical protein
VPHVVQVLGYWQLAEYWILGFIDACTMMQVLLQSN